MDINGHGYTFRDPSRICQSEVLEIEVAIILLGHAPAIGFPDRLFKFNKE